MSIIIGWRGPVSLDCALELSANRKEVDTISGLQGRELAVDLASPF